MKLPTAFKPIQGKHPKLKFWSYSMWSKWKTCPLSAKYKWLDKRADPPGPAAHRGNTIHDAAEAYLKRPRSKSKLPAELRPWLPRLRVLVSSDAVAEEPWGFDKDWGPVGWREAWLRMKLDARVTELRHGRVVDYKTGKRYDSHRDQGELYALGTFLRHPQLETLDVEFWYIDQKLVDVLMVAQQLFTDGCRDETQVRIRPSFPDRT